MHVHLLDHEMAVVCRTIKCEGADREWKARSLTAE